MSRALVLVDIQRDYFPGGRLPLHEPEAAAAKAGEVLERFRASGEPVVHIKHLSAPGGGFLEEGTDGTDHVAPVEPAEGEAVVEKRSPNAFLHTDLEERLRSQQVDEVVVVGMMTSMCVDATTRAGADLGFEMTVVEDACATPDLEHEGRKVPAPDVQAAFLAALGSAYATVVPADDLG